MMKKLIKILNGGQIEMWEDFLAWCEWKKKSPNLKTFFYLFWNYTEFRKQIDFRLAMGGARFARLITYMTSRSHNLYITSYRGIKGGLMIQHGFSTIITCQSMGRCCKINQQVTIGWKDSGCPTIGDYVIVGCGAKVLGGIVIGDDVVIGSNAVVVKDVPSHCMVVGIPARIVKRRKNMEEDWTKVF